MRLSLAQKIIATTLIGIVLLLGGGEVVSAGQAPTAGQTAPITAQSAHPQGWAYNTSTTVGVTTWSGAFTDITTCQAAAQAAGGSNCTQLLGVAGGAGIGTNGNLANTTPPLTADEKLLKDYVCGIEFDIKKPTETKFGIKGCLPIWTYYLIYKPTSYLLMGGGYIFDKGLHLSIYTPTVDQGFVTSSWIVIRDFSNMLFIFILLYTGISTMLGAKDWRGVVLKVIVIALLINFSLFFTKVVIDAGNVLAVGVYDAITQGDTAHSTSERLAGAFKPQQFILASKDPQSPIPPPDIMDMTIVFIIVAIVNGFAAYTFFRAGLLFIGRLIAFWFLMIISPFAFISTALPKGNIFNFWWGTLLSQAFVAPVYLFFIYLILQITNVPGGIVGNALTAAHDLSWFDKLIPLILMAVMLVFAMQKSLKLAEGMAGDFGAMGAKMAGSVLGVAGGVALGGTALVGRAAGGRIAQGLHESGTFQKMATGNSMLGRFAGRQLLGVNEKARTGTWDARGTGLGQKAAKAAGVDVGKPSASAKGGYAGAQTRQLDEDLKFAKKLEVTDKEKMQKAAELEPGYTKAVASRAGRQKEEPTARKKKEEAEKQAKQSTTGQAKTAMEGNLAAKETAFKEAAKTKEEAQKAQNAQRVAGNPLNPATTAALKKAEDEEQAALETVKKAQEALETATATHAVSAEGQALNKATKDLSAIETQIKEATEIIKSGDTEATKWAAEENKTRRGVQANYVEGGARTAVRWATGNATYSHRQAQETASQVRAGTKPKSDSDHAKEATRLAKELTEAKEAKVDDKVIEHIEKKIEAHDDKKGK